MRRKSANARNAITHKHAFIFPIGTVEMKSYLALLRKVLEEGTVRDDRTGIGTIGIFGETLSFDLQQGFPLLTTKTMNHKAIFAELMTFLEGSTSARDFRENGTKIWDANANEEKSWLQNPFRKGEDDLGPIYGAQWRRWPATKIIDEALPHSGAMISSVMSRGYTFQGYIEGLETVGLYTKEIDQIAALLATLESNPADRRMLVSAWNPGQIDEMALPPCHYAFQCHVDEGYLNLMMHMRSADMFLGVPFNIASYAMLIHWLCAQTRWKLKPGRLVITLGDVHIYKNHVEQVEEQLQRIPKRLPEFELFLNGDGGQHGGREWTSYTLDHYNPHPAIKAPMAV